MANDDDVGKKERIAFEKKFSKSKTGLPSIPPDFEKREERVERALEKPVGIPDEIELDENTISPTFPNDVPEGLGEPEPEAEEETEKIESIEPDIPTEERMERRRPIPQELQRSIQEQPFQNFGVIIMNILSSTQPRQYVKLYHFIKILAKRLDEPKIVKELNEIYKGVKVIGANEKKYSIPLSVLQYVFDRDSGIGYSPTKTYQKKQITLAGIIIALDNVMETLIDHYMILCDEHNIPLEAPSQPPNFGAVSADDLPDAGM